MSKYIPNIVAKHPKTGLYFDGRAFLAESRENAKVLSNTQEDIPRLLRAFKLVWEVEPTLLDQGSGYIYCETVVLPPVVNEPLGA